jgi:hypothetical protein
MKGMCHSLQQLQVQCGEHDEITELGAVVLPEPALYQS